MNIVLFGASGMVGQGVLRECLDDERVTSVTAVGRSPLGLAHAKLREIVHRDFANFSALASEFKSADACFFCLGVSSAGVNEDAYRAITYDTTLAAARALPQSPSFAFIYVSGEGTDSTERGRRMWARVKGRTENALLALPFRAFMFRPAYIQPVHGVTSRTAWVRWLYACIVMALSAAAARDAEARDDDREHRPRDACGRGGALDGRDNPAQPGDQ